MPLKRIAKAKLGLRFLYPKPYVEIHGLDPVGAPAPFGLPAGGYDIFVEHVTRKKKLDHVHITVSPKP